MRVFASHRLCLKWKSLSHEGTVKHLEVGPLAHQPHKIYLILPKKVFEEYDLVINGLTRLIKKASKNLFFEIKKKKLNNEAKSQLSQSRNTNFSQSNKNI